MKTEHPSTEQHTKKEATCPDCGAPQSEWPRPGVWRDGRLHCCKGCAEGIGCTCDEETEEMESAE
jgi:hypothetical protein